VRFGAGGAKDRNCGPKSGASANSATFAHSQFTAPCNVYPPMHLKKFEATQRHGCAVIVLICV